MKLSICMMVKNEEKRLDECLTALKPILEQLESELIIVDTGSTDSTVEIAKRHTQNVYFHIWENDFSGMRNVTLSYAKGKWVFIIDGDEVLEDAQPVIDFLKSGEERNFNTATVKVKNLVDEEGQNFTMMTSHRLFKKDKNFRYEGKVHNQPVFKSPLKHIEAMVVHYGYISTDKGLMERKFERTAAILKNELESDPENLYYLYQLSESYGMHKDFEKALDPVMKAYNIIKDKNLNKKKYLYVLIGAAKWNMRNMRLLEAENILKDTLAVAEDYIDIQCYLGYSIYLQNRKKDAIPYFERYAELVENFDELKSSKDISVKHDSLSDKIKIYEMLAQIYYETQEYEKSLGYWIRVEKETELGRLRKNIIICYIKLKNYEQLYQYYLKLKYANKQDFTKGIIETLENVIRNSSDEEIKAISRLFKDENNDYSTLCQTRLALIDEVQEEGLIDKIYSMDLENLMPYHSDIILYLLENKLDMVPWLQRSYEESLNKMMIHLIGRGNKSGKIKTQIWHNPAGIIESKIQNLARVILEYINYFEEINILDKQEENKIDYYRLYKALCRYPLAAYSIDDEMYKKLFDKYICYGRLYISSIYQLNILSLEKVYHLKGEEDGFLLYINKAMEVKEKDKTEYIKYLRKSLNIFELRKGIEILLNELKDEDNNVSNPEMELLKKQFKDNIKVMIDNNMIAEAGQLIEQYEQMIADDVEILLFKSQISLIKIQRYDNIEQIN